MKIASITITMNDYHSLNQWSRFYQEHKTAIFKHIIVDNNSKEDYKGKLKTLFPDSEFIERKSNGGTTAAYNDGIRHALSFPEVEAIMLLSNDIRINEGSINRLANLLDSDKDIGGVAPILLNTDERTIITHGELLKPDMGIKRLFEGKLLEDDLPEIVPSECLPGGMNMVRKEVYEKVGLQDETLFMYMDENDFFYRVKKAGFKLVSLKNALATHYHIPTEGTKNDNSLAWFYTNRNHLLICKKYKPYVNVINLFLRKLFWQGPKISCSFLREGSLKKIYYYYLGSVLGFIDYRKNFLRKP